MIEKLTLYQRVYDFILYAFPVINRFPKSQKFVLGQQIQNLTIEIIKKIIYANACRDKYPALLNIDVDLQVLKTLIRLSNDLKFIDLRRYHIFCQKLTEIGKIFTRLSDQFQTFHSRKSEINQCEITMILL